MSERTNENQKLLGLIPMSWRLELTAWPVLRWLFKRRWFPMIFILVNLAIFVVILTSGLMGGFSAGNYSFGVMIVWILWWVLLMMFMVPVVGRLWCMVCPFPLIGEWLQRGKLIGVGRQKSWGLNKKWPSKWKNLWPLVILFWISTWFSGFFTVRPLATFLLLGAIILLAIVASIIFEKRTFCITMCPVSGFMGLYSNFSLCAVRRKDPEVCKKHVPKTCYVGNQAGYGCPWMELPYDMNRNTYCGLCLECFKTCPHDNMGFFLRPPGQDLLVERRRTDDTYNRRGLDEAFKGLTMVGIFMTFFLTFQGPFGYLKDNARATTFGGYLTYVAESFCTDFLIIPGLFLLVAFLSKTLSGNREVKLKTVFVNLSYCLVPFGLAIWAGFSLGIILPNGSYLLHILSDPFARGWNLLGTANFPWTPVFTGWVVTLQLAVLFIGYLVSADFGYKLAARTYADRRAARRAFVPLLTFLTLAVIGIGWLYGG